MPRRRGGRCGGRRRRGGIPHVLRSVRGFGARRGGGCGRALCRDYGEDTRRDRQRCGLRLLCAEDIARRSGQARALYPARRDDRHRGGAPVEDRRAPDDAADDQQRPDARVLGRQDIAPDRYRLADDADGAARRGACRRARIRLAREHVLDIPARYIRGVFRHRRRGAGAPHEARVGPVLER